MKMTTKVPTVGALALVAVAAGAGVAQADGAADAPDPAVVAAREAAAMEVLPPGYDNPAPVAPIADGVQVNVNDNYLFTAKTTSNGYLEVVGRDHPAQDKPGYLTTTLRVYGNVAAYRTGSGSIELTSRFTCSGVGISGLTVGSGGASVSGGVTSSTLTWRSSRTSSTEVRQAYTEGGHFRCTASNAGPAKFTRRASALTSYKTGDTRAESSYSFWW
ncbi:MAG: hypothetical protein R2701_12400 [Acidimicrobiales bacterium]|nr:hypothetical protein [Acidimicrobiales bacterium]